MTISSLVFPSFLSNPAYENKKVTFKVIKPSIESTDEMARLQNAIKFVYAPQDTMVNLFTNTSNTVSNAVSNAAGHVSSNAFGVPAGFDLESSVTLPYPISLSDNQNHNWENAEGLLAQGIHAAAGAIGSGISKLSEGNKEGKKNIISKALSFLSNGSVSPDKLYGALANKLGVRKAVIDPGYFQNYTGSTPRTFTMAYTLVPQSQKEAQTIKDIILWFKQYSSPTFVENTPLMGAPFVFNISFAGNQYITDMFKMDKCVLTGISVDYASDGSFMLFKDGFPKQIGLALNFAEVELKYAQEYAGLTREEITDKRNKLEDSKLKD